MKTNTKQVKQAIQQHILDAIDMSEQNNPEATTKESLEFIASEFRRVTYEPYHRIHARSTHHGPSIQELFHDWTMGLPSYFNIEFETYRALEVMAEFGLPLPEGKTDEEGWVLYHQLIFREYLALCEQHGVNFYQIINS